MQGQKATRPFTPGGSRDELQSFINKPGVENYYLPIPQNAVNGLTEKEQADIEQMKNTEYKNRKRLGFLAQDVKALFPELVEEDKDGYLYVDYVGLIPVLVESVKEQQEQIDNLLKLAAKKGLLTYEE